LGRVNDCTRGQGIFHQGRKIIYGSGGTMSWNNIIPIDIILYETYVEKCKEGNIKALSYADWKKVEENNERIKRDKNKSHEDD
jgi:hypothetical protein